MTDISSVPVTQRQPVPPKLFLAFDTETNGLPRWDLPANHPTQPRMVQLAMALFDATGEIRAQYEGLVRPDGWEIPDEVVRVHGITTETCVKLGKPIAEIMTNFDAMQEKCAELVGYNPAFDLKIIRGEYRRLDRPDRYGYRPKIDLMGTCTKLCQIAPSEAMMASGRKTAKTAKLTEAVQILLGRQLDRAHDAMADVRGVIDLWLYLNQKGKLPEAKHDIGRKDGPAPASAAPPNKPIAEF